MLSGRTWSPVAAAGGRGAEAIGLGYRHTRVKSTTMRAPYRHRLAIAGVASLTIALSGCGRNGNGPACREFEIMETTASVCAPRSAAESLDNVLFIASNHMDRLDKLLSIKQPHSEITALNRVGGVVRLPIAADTHRILSLAKEYNAQTDGAFDITVAPLTYLWGFHGTNKPEKALSPELIESALRGIGNQFLIIDEHTARLGSPYTRLDVGGILQGYAVDISVLSMRRQGIPNVMVRLGDQARCLGTAGTETPWSIDISNPHDSSQLLATLTLTNGQASATSSFGNNSIVLNGERYAHIVDPRTGWPIKGMASTTVIAPTATMADALATALFVAGMKECQRILDRYPRCDALLIPDTDPLEIWITKRLIPHLIVQPGHWDAVRVLNVVE